MKDGIERDLDELRRLMHDEGHSPWTAARELQESGMTSREQSTLFYHAKKLEGQSPNLIAFDVEQAVRNIADGSSVLIPAGMRATVVEALESAGIAYVRKPRKVFEFSAPVG